MGEKGGLKEVRAILAALKRALPNGDTNRIISLTPDQIALLKEFLEDFLDEE